MHIGMKLNKKSKTFKLKIMEKKQSSIEFAIEKITQFMTEDNDFEFGLIA